MQFNNSTPAGAKALKKFSAFSFIYTCVVNNKKGLNGKYRWLRHQKSARSQHP